MKKIILFFVLSLLLLSFLVFFINVWRNLSDYRNKNGEVGSDSPVTGAIDDRESHYSDYSKNSYDMAINEKRVTVLFFTSNWCQQCIEQDKVNSSVFDDLKSQGLVGLRIHILDSETTTETDALAKKFDIIKENSFVILNKDGAVQFKHVGDLESEQLKQKIEEVIFNL